MVRTEFGGRGWRSRRAGVAMAAGGVFGAMASIASAQTAVCGPITTNTTWGLAGSPYLVTCDVVVTDGAILTIEPGVEVRLDQNRRLAVQTGRLVAVGTASQRITFTSNNPAAGQRGSGVQFVQGFQFGGTLAYADFTQMNTGVAITGCCGGPEAAPTIDQCRFIGLGVAITGYYGTALEVSNSRIEGCSIGATDADKVFRFCTFVDNTWGLLNTERVSVYDSTFTGHDEAVNNGGRGVFERNTVTGNTIGLRLSSEGFTTRRNVIAGNGRGVLLPFSSFLNPFECNDVYGNTTFNVEMSSNATITLANNWWGSTDPGVIAAGIKDGVDQAGLGFLLVDPVLPGAWATTSTCACTTPVIDVQPMSVSATPGGSASFSVSVTAVGSPTYEWLRDGRRIESSPRFSGVFSPTLTINPVAEPGSESAWTDAGAYSVVVSNICGTVVSDSAVLSTPTCPGDFNNNGSISVQDLFDFVAAYFGGCP